MDDSDKWCTGLSNEDCSNAKAHLGVVAVATGGLSNTKKPVDIKPLPKTKPAVANRFALAEDDAFVNE